MLGGGERVVRGEIRGKNQTNVSIHVFTSKFLPSITTPPVFLSSTELLFFHLPPAPPHLRYANRCLRIPVCAPGGKALT